MSDFFNNLLAGLTLTGELSHDIPAFLRHHQCPKTAVHCCDVAREARRIADRVGVNADDAESAGWLHDVSAVFPVADRIEVAEQLAIDILPEEIAYPMIIHQKLSAVLGKKIFDIHDVSILSAVECHTTLKAGASILDKVVFVADKLAWDQPGLPPYKDDMDSALEISIDESAKVYLQYLWNQRATLRVIHPWFRAAYQEMFQDSVQ